MKTAIIIAALLATVPAMAQNGSQQGNRTNYRFYMPDRWWPDQDSCAARCERYPDGPFRERLRAECIEKVMQR